MIFIKIWKNNLKYFLGCMVEPFPESFDASVSAWQWPGAYPYAAADSAYTNFLACLKALYIGVSILILFKLWELNLNLKF